MRGVEEKSREKKEEGREGYYQTRAERKCIFSKFHLSLFLLHFLLQIWRTYLYSGFTF